MPAYTKAPADSASFPLILSTHLTVMKIKNLLSLIILSSTLSFGGILPVTIGASASQHAAKPAPKKSVQIAQKNDDGALPLKFFLAVVFYLTVVNTPPFRRWQMYRHMLLKPIKTIPDSDLDGLIVFPSVAARANMIGANGEVDEEVSLRTDLVASPTPLHRCTKYSKLWYHKILRSDVGIVDHSAIDSCPPWTSRKLFLLGERSIICNIFSKLPYGSLGSRSYCNCVDGSLYLLIVCPFFTLTRFGTLIPSKGFAVKVRPNGFCEFLGIEEAQRNFPNACLFPAAVAAVYAHAYAEWSAGIIGKFWRRSKPLQFFKNSLTDLSNPQVARYSKLGNQYTSFLGVDSDTGGALNVVLLFDVKTGGSSLFVREKGQIIIGPVEALDVVRLKNTTKSDHRFSEPQLICRNGELYWLICLMFSKDASYAVLGHYLVDAATGNIVSMLKQAVLEDGVSAIDRALPRVTDAGHVNN